MQYQETRPDDARRLFPPAVPTALLAVLSTPGCDLLGDIAEFSLWVLLLVVLLVALLIYGIIRALF
ncbi:MAG: hypothetical protein AB1671_22010 [Thermodesulfobacteriota bacterium]|jgi:hypothetical protein